MPVGYFDLEASEMTGSFCHVILPRDVMLSLHMEELDYQCIFYINESFSIFSVEMFYFK